MECGMLENSVVGEAELRGSVQNPEDMPFGESGKLHIGESASESGQGGGPSDESSGAQSNLLGAGSVTINKLVWTLVLAVLSIWIQW